jgi:hypothetical protein
MHLSRCCISAFIRLAKVYGPGVLSESAPCTWRTQITTIRILEFVSYLKTPLWHVWLLFAWIYFFFSLNRQSFGLQYSERSLTALSLEANAFQLV